MAAEPGGSMPEPPPNRPRLPRSWSDWASGDWLGAANPLGAARPGLAGLPTPEDMAALAPVFGPQQVLRRLITEVQQRLVGRAISFTTGAGEWGLVPTGLAADPQPLGLTLAQLGTIEVAATGVRSPWLEADRGTATFRNVHVQPGVPAVLVAAPVDLHVVLGQEALDRLLVAHLERFSVRLDGEGRALVALAGRERTGWAEVVPRLEGRAVRLVATGIGAIGRRIPLPRAMGTLRLELPPFPEGLRLDAIEIVGGEVQARGALDELRLPLASGRLQRFERLMRQGAARFDLLTEE